MVNSTPLYRESVTKVRLRPGETTTLNRNVTYHEILGLIRNSLNNFLAHSRSIAKAYLVYT
jgi:hypothetical protein